MTKVLDFSRPFKTPKELSNISEVLASDHMHGDGPFTASATAKLRSITGSSDALLTTSGTHALEMASHLLGLKLGDEVIVPSFTFASGATAIVAVGATPVFVDIEGLTGNISPEAVAAAITPQTKAISVMHYGGQPVDMGAILQIAGERNIPVVEDNAHGLGVQSSWGTLGTIGTIGIQSFHDSKNVHCGEGGAILLNDTDLVERAEIMREKGTNRTRFLRGQVDKYTWVDWGSSYLPSELNAAILDAQLDEFENIQARRHRIWDSYRAELADWADSSRVELMTPPEGAHAAHVFYLLMPTSELRDEALKYLRAHDVMATFHYVPLHSSPAGRKFGRTAGSLERTDDFAARQIRLPLFTGMTDEQIAHVIASLKSFPVNS